MENLTKETFLEKIFDFNEQKEEFIFKGDKPAIIDFYADWCGPCKQLSPTLDDLSTEYSGKVDFYKINTEEESELSAMFGIQSIPSVLFIPMDGKPAMATGSAPKESIQESIKNFLKVE